MIVSMHAIKKFVLAIGMVLQVIAFASAQEPQSAIAKMLEPGPEARMLSARAGDWKATVTLWPSKGSAPVVLKDLPVQRAMIGNILQETMSNIGPGAFTRIDYLDYNRIEARWQYVSMDTRFPVGLMPASSVILGSSDHISLQFEPFAFPGWGSSVEGWMLRMTCEITGIGTDHEINRQYWTRADGTGERWVGVEYDYRRIQTPKVIRP